MKTEQIENLKLIFPKFDFVIAAYLFGSRLNFIDKIDSDLDIAILVKEDFLKAPTFIQATTGTVLYQTNSKEKIAFQMSVIKRYCDFKPTLQLIEKFHIKGIKYRLGIA